MRRSDSGLTLLELLIALAVIAIVFLALASGQITSMQTSAGSRDISDAKTYANRKMEDARNGVIFDVILEGGAAATEPQMKTDWAKYYDVKCFEVTPADCKGSIANSRGYQADWTIGPKSLPHNAANLSDEGLLQINMTVSWSFRGANKTLSLVDYISCAEVAPIVCPDPIDPDP